MQSGPRGQFTATVSANIPLCRDHFRLVLSLQNFPPTRPGQFVQLACAPLGMEAAGDTQFDWPQSLPIAGGDAALAGPLAMLRRPFSLAGRRDGPDGRAEIDIIHRIVGVGTGWLGGRAAGDAVGVLGPLGNAFALPPSGHTALLVGGGVGIPPMLYLAAALAGRPAVAFAGAITEDLLPLTIMDQPADAALPAMRVAEFADCGIPSILATDDGSLGVKGFVTQALERYLDHQLTGPATIYTCGPEPMMKRVAEIALARGIDCQVAVERAMACGMGTCQSCCIRVRKTNIDAPPLAGQPWCYRLACTDGPIFQAADLLW